MACERTSNRIGKVGAISSGIATLSNKTGQVVGLMAMKMDQVRLKTDQAIDRVGRTTAPLTAITLKVVGPDEPTKKALGALVGATAATGLALAVVGVGENSQWPHRVRALAASARLAARTLLPQAYPALKVIQATDRLTSAVGTGLGRLSQTGPAGTVTQEKRRLLFFKQQVPVSLWKSSLTPLLNKRDVIGTTQAQKVVSSRGVMFTTGGKTWHQGTTVVKMPAGRRTLTHLQSLSLPASHYFFDRPVSKERSVGLASGTLKPAEVPGFVGQVSAAESLCPAWAANKQTLIKAHLHWPPEQ